MENVAPADEVASDQPDYRSVQSQEGKAQSDLAMGQDAIPDLLRVGEISSNQMAHIDTEVLEPVIFNDAGDSGFIRFQITNKGFLNPYSRICFSLKNNDTANAEGTLPVNVGVGSLFKRVCLKIGGKTICELDDFSNFYAYKSMFVAGEMNKEREQYLSGRIMSHHQHYLKGTAAAAAVGSYHGNVSREVSLDTGRDYAAGNLEINSFAELSKEGVFSITLEDLLPVFKATAIPLYLLNSDQPVQIELTLNPSVDRWASTVGTTNAAAQMTINRNDCRMIADYTTYDLSIMESYAAANPVISWTFMDYQLSKTSYATAGAAQSTIRNIGGAGRLVPRVFNCLSLNSDTNTTLMNKYTAQALENAGGVDYGKLTTNLKKNDKFLYPIDRSNTALHFHSVKDTEGFLPFITRDEYSGQGDTLTGDTYMGRAQKGSLSGKFFWNAYKVNDGERVGSRGLELHNKYVSLPAGAYTGRCWIEAVKIAVLENGRFDCYFA